MDTNWLLSVLERANTIASTTQLDTLLELMLDLIIDVCGAQAGTLYLLDQPANELIFSVVKDIELGSSSPLVGQRMQADAGIVGATIQERSPIVVADVETDPRWYRGFTEISGRKLRNMISFPLLLQERPIGVVQVFNYQRSELQLVQLLGSRMASEVDKAILLSASLERAARLQALVDIIGKISASLDRDEILRMIIEYARMLLDAEASSLFLVDPPTGDLLPYFATNIAPDQLGQLRVPAGKGVIGYAVQRGQSVLVKNARQDSHYYSGVDEVTGFETRSILAVPLSANAIDLGGERGSAEQRILGGLEAINKRQGVFDADDRALLETLANQAATVLQIADLYANANELFIGVVRALTAAVDAKDPYTEGHSQRVSDFSVEIGRQMNLGPEEVHHLRIAGLLHDVGKIGVSDRVLKKPGKLNRTEYEEIKLHPQIGERIMRQVRMLENELPGISQHHERVDGAGYPRGLAGEGLSLAGRIIAVADVFDALTSDRPYRKSVTVKQAFQTLRASTGEHFDPACVEALACAYDMGLIRTQKERPERTSKAGESVSDR